MSKALVQPCLIRSRIRSAYDVDTFTWLFGLSDLKRNTFLLFGLLVIDLVMYHFSIMTMFHYSSAITFMCVGLIINMVLYLKYRTYLINN